MGWDGIRAWTMVRAGRLDGASSPVAPGGGVPHQPTGDVTTEYFGHRHLLRMSRESGMRMAGRLARVPAAAGALVRQC